jgi:hypothetical protein
VVRGLWEEHSSSGVGEALRRVASIARARHYQYYLPFTLRRMASLLCSYVLSQEGSATETLVGRQKGVDSGGFGRAEESGGGGVNW